MRANGECVFVDDPNLPKTIDPGDECEVRIARSILLIDDWHTKARARLNDGTTVCSVEDNEVPAFGNIKP